MKLAHTIKQSRSTYAAMALANAQWLESHMSPRFFQAMVDEPETLETLARGLDTLRHNRRLVLADREQSLILAGVDCPGSLYETVRRIPVEQISYAMFFRSSAAMPTMDEALEVRRFEFDRRPHASIDPQRAVDIAPKLQRAILRELRSIDPSFDRQRSLRFLSLLWQNNPTCLAVSPPARTARFLWLLSQNNVNGGLLLDLQQVEHEGQQKTRLLCAVDNPSQEDFLLQALEVFNRLEISVHRAYCHTISNGIHPYFLGTFYLNHHSGQLLSSDSTLVRRMQQELCNTQILDNTGYSYREWMTKGLLTGNEATLINAFVAFCHTNLAHNSPDCFGLDSVQSAFHCHPEMSLKLVQLFRLRFDPELPDRENYPQALAEVKKAIADYNTGHPRRDTIRRTIYHCCLLLISHTLKTNFFVVEKQALAFRLDPTYLQELGSEFTADLPKALPFRISFFFSRYGHGYHIGFSDIARGGWRTVIAHNQDDAITAAGTLLREAYVLAHTQHLKNKDIYEGGSKLVVVMDARDLDPSDRGAETCRLNKLQYSIANAFLDIFITSNGKARNPQVVDYYADDEAIELGPDENMHEHMIEALADLSKSRGYLLGVGIISSKRFGINHKQYGVTSTGVMTFVEVVMKAQGIDIRHDPFSLKLTGGPGGDVAGNCLRLTLERCPQARITLVLDGTAAAYDPAGLSHEELQRITLRHDLDHFDPARLAPGGVMLFRSGQRTEGLKQLHRRVERLPDGSLQERWVPLDDFHREYSSLVFSVATDLFIPAGGRPETIDGHNWKSFLLQDGRPSASVIVEGANSFITPQARLELQKAGCVIMRDASANKCGVISSSYEIIANLLMSEQEFETVKERYVTDVLTILEKRAGDEARLILNRYQELGGSQPYTEISNQISQNINTYYGRLFQFFSQRPHLCLQRPFREALLRHLPALLRDDLRFRRRISRLPHKYQAAILAAEIGASLVYTGDRDADFEQMIRSHLQRTTQQEA